MKAEHLLARQLLSIQWLTSSRRWHLRWVADWSQPAVQRGRGLTIGVSAGDSEEDFGILADVAVARWQPDNRGVGVSGLLDDGQVGVLTGTRRVVIDVSERHLHLRQRRRELRQGDWDSWDKETGTKGQLRQTGRQGNRWGRETGTETPETGTERAETGRLRQLRQGDRDKEAAETETGRQGNSWDSWDRNRDSWDRETETGTGRLSRSDVIGVISLQLRSFLEVLLVVQTEPSRRWPVYSV